VEIQQIYKTVDIILTAKKKKPSIFLHTGILLIGFEGRRKKRLTTSVKGKEQVISSAIGRKLPPWA
jgi:hypothetical protein